MMKCQMPNVKCQILIIFSLLAAFSILLTTNYQPPTAYAQACPTQSTNPRVQNGLISTPDISGSQVSGNNKFSNPLGICATGTDKISFAPYKIPTYDDLKSMYYTQSKATKVPSNNTNISPITSSDDRKIFNYTASDVNINGTYNYNGTAVIFVEGNMIIKGDIRAHDPAIQGLVFVVKKDVIIDKSVAQIEAVLISSGHIYTAVDTGGGSSPPYSCSHASPIAVRKLTVYGSLISLDESKTIEFCRTLGANDDTTPAEVINQQPKYLVILRDLFSDTLQKWSEIQ